MPDWSVEVVERAFPGARVLASAAAPGGISGNARFVSVESADGSRLEVVIKRPGSRFGRVDHMRVEREFRLLAAARSAGIPAARPIYIDEEWSALVMERLPGAPAFRPRGPRAAAEALAESLAALHLAFTGEAGRHALAAAISVGLTEVSRDPSQLAESGTDPDESLGETRIRAVLAAAWPPEPNPVTLLHGDFWPGNVLWQDERITGVVDWEDARLGDPLEDVAITRLDVWWQFGEDAMEAFTARYFSLVPWPRRALPVWDLVAALRPCGQLQDWAHGLDDVPSEEPHITEGHMRAVHAEFVQRAISGAAV